MASSTRQAVVFRADFLERTLRQHVDGEIRFDRATRAIYSTDASHYQIEPVGVVSPRTQADLVTALGIILEQRVPIVARGGGTSLSGQTIGAGVVIDCSRWLNRILETDVEQQTVRVEPGVILAQLNKQLAPVGFQFGPDVSTIDRAALGGMIGNNSAGSRSIRYGKTADHVISLDTILSDGKRVRFAQSTADQLRQGQLGSDRFAEVCKTVERIAERDALEIDARFPKILRRVSGYNLDLLLEAKPWNLARLLVGSEGTLGVVAEAKLRIVPIPKCRAIVVLHFNTLADAMRTLMPILATTPSAIELMDRMIVDLARANPDYRCRVDFVQGNPAALFIVEYSGEDPSQIDRQLATLEDAIKGFAVAAVVRAVDKKLCDHIWAVRKVALPLLFALPGNRKPVTFVEDTAVSPEKLPEFVERFRAILQRHGTDGSFYGHASVGCLHIRPLLDLRAEKDRAAMTRIADEICALVMEFGGSMSGEHGDGLARSHFNRRLFGDRIYNAFCELKRAFDPDDLLNPGKIVNGPPITDDLRPTDEVQPPVTSWSFAEDGGILPVVERCNGNALCRRLDIGVMCPSYRVTLDERHSPRGRANLVRSAIRGQLGVADASSWATPELHESLDLCLMCKACKTECPSSVDISKVKTEYLQERHRTVRPTMLERKMAQIRESNQLGSRFAPLSNWVLHSPPTRWLMDRMLGIDRRRKLPAYQRRSVPAWFSNRKTLCKRARGKVVFLADCFTSYCDTAVGRAGIELLELAGYQVHLASICCGRTLISKGFLTEAKKLAADGIERLMPYVEEGVPVLGVEPSCLLTLTDEWRDLVPGNQADRVAKSSLLLEHWLLDRYEAGETDLPNAVPESSAPTEVLIHGHCHQKAALAFDKSVQALERLAGVKPQVIESGCCGMAGSFGYECGKYDMSVAIAEQQLLPALRRNADKPVVASGFSCRCQIADLANRKSQHPVQVIRATLSD